MPKPTLRIVFMVGTVVSAGSDSGRQKKTNKNTSEMIAKQTKNGRRRSIDARYPPVTGTQKSMSFQEGP